MTQAEWDATYNNIAQEYANNGVASSYYQQLRMLGPRPDGFANPAPPSNPGASSGQDYSIQRPTLTNGNTWGAAINGGYQILGPAGNTVGYWNSSNGSVSDQPPGYVAPAPAQTSPLVGSGPNTYNPSATYGDNPSNVGTPLGISFHGPTQQQIDAGLAAGNASKLNQIINDTKNNPAAIAALAAPVVLGGAALAIPAMTAAGAGDAALTAGMGIPGTVGAIGAAGDAAGATTAGAGIAAAGAAGAGAAGATGAAGAGAAGATGAAGAGAAGATGAAAGASVSPGALASLASLLHISSSDAAGLVMGGGALAQGLLSLAAGNQQAEAIKSAAQTQQQSFKDALNQQQAQFDKTNEINQGIYNIQQANMAPWIQQGTKALNQIPDQITGYNAPTYQKFGMDQFQQDPGYSFRLSEGLKALQNSAAARGGLLSGNTMKGITDYAQGAASQEYQNAFNRYQNEYQNNFNNYQTQFGTKLNALQSLAGLGQTSMQQANQSGSNYANNAMQSGQNFANQAGQALVGGAQAYGQGQTGAAQASASGYVGAGNALNNALSSYFNYNQSQGLMNALMRNNNAS